ncbi:hypothetical protein BV898_18947 [Hypsibius exemplaris]|uniref:G-protein coupled receptors family 1 profile domain-containing protein n=1 Tax=Hypsibius exemplaris TaxID=2072580 RepID=A0A9X6RP10_HYPEX|nr:hypothetical protein BV898_18947 [Hypsibius exemplaris]
MSIVEHFNLSLTGNNTVLTDRYCITPYNASTPKVSNPDPAVMAWKFLTGIVCAIGVFSNLLVLIILLKTPILRKGAGRLVAHLLICHLVLCAAIFPTVLHYVDRASNAAITGIPVDCQACRYRHPFHVTFNALVNWSEALLALNRLTAVLLPFHHRSLLRGGVVQYFGLTLVWLNALYFGVAISGWEHFDLYKMTSIGTCAAVIKTDTLVSLLSFNFYGPFALITVAAVVIIGKMVISKRALRSGRVESSLKPGEAVVSPETSHPNAVTMSKRQKRISLMMLVCFLFNLISQLPQCLLTLLGVSFRYPKVTLYIWLLALVQYAAIPVIFLTVNKDYQSKAKTLYVLLMKRSVGVRHVPDQGSRSVKFRVGNPSALNSAV